jgi:hypothetical protein
MSSNPLATGVFRSTIFLVVSVSSPTATAAFGKSPESIGIPTQHRPIQVADPPFLREYALGVQRIPMEGGKIYGWKLNDKVTFGRFKGESYEFGFSVELDRKQRVEITTDGLRWRRSLGGSH